MIQTVAPAKINWTLEVLGKRDDGYHQIRTILQTIELHDEMSVEEADGFYMDVKGPYRPGPDDLILRAASAFAAERNVSGVSIRLDKRVPVAAGLGGGSSDAAATLRGMGQLFASSEEQVAKIAEGIGSDVPFFLRGGTALAEGRGERITPLADASEAWLVLVVPAIQMADKTRTMYGTLTSDDFSDGSRTSLLAEAIERGEAVAEEMLCNSFERAAHSIFPGLSGFRDWMIEAGARSVHLSGAGPALFALASGEPEARAIRARMNRARRGERVYVVRTIPASESTLAWRT